MLRSARPTAMCQRFCRSSGRDRGQQNGPAFVGKSLGHGRYHRVVLTAGRPDGDAKRRRLQDVIESSGSGQKDRESDCQDQQQGTGLFALNILPIAATKEDICFLTSLPALLLTQSVLRPIPPTGNLRVLPAVPQTCARLLGFMGKRSSASRTRPSRRIETTLGGRVPSSDLSRFCAARALRIRAIIGSFSGDYKCNGPTADYVLSCAPASANGQQPTCRSSHAAAEA
jgi:hypothetical protein